MKNLTIFLVLFLSIVSYSQELTGDELLEKAIQYHDPNGNWETFQGTLFVSMETPDKPVRNSEIRIDLPKEVFYVKASRGGNTTEYLVDKGACTITFNGEENLSEEIRKKHSLSCERATLYRNYYTYLYGLPMKLKDKGTIVHQKVERKNFQQKDYLVLKVTYDKHIGKDIWYFYFDPNTYAMEIYQFFKDESKNDGEYILLTDEVIVNDIKMPKNRAWYYNKDDGYLGTDILKKQQ